MNLKTKIATVFLVASFALLSLNMTGTVNAAPTAETGSSLVSVRDTLVNRYQVSSGRITFNPANGYVQVDGLDILKPKSIVNGISYDTADALQAVGEKESVRHPLTFVLVHGAWADSSYFDGVAGELRKMGYNAYTPEYAGHGASANKKATHEQMTASVVDYIKEKDLHDIVLLGHSFGGTVVEKAAEQIPDRIKRLVFFDAFVPQDGQSVVDQFPAPIQELFDQLRSASTDDTIALPFSIFRDTLANKASLDIAKAIYSHASPEPAGPLFEKLDLKKFYGLEIPKSYLYLNEDAALPQGDFGWHPTQSSRLGVYRFIEGDGDHISTAITQPKTIAEKIVEAGRD